MENLYVGPCGFCMKQAELFQTFSAMEIQQTFYHPPQLKTVERWRRDAPEAFRFTLKAWQAITHRASSPTYRRSKLSAAEREGCGDFRDSAIVRSAWQVTAELARALAAQFVVFQCPPAFDASAKNVQNLKWFFSWADRHGLIFGWEPRHVTWSDTLIRELCSELDLVHVVDPLEQPSLYGAPRYFRLHGQFKGNFRYEYKHQYSDSDLVRLADLCDGTETYMMFNNSAMAADGPRFLQLAGQRGK